MLSDIARTSLRFPIHAFHQTLGRWCPAFFTSFGRRHLTIALLALLALVPVIAVLVLTADGRLNLAYWDEFETALALLLKLKQGLTPGAFIQELFALSNEHRMVTSRFLFALSYWLTGTINFSVFGWLGVSWLLVTCGLLVATAGSTSRRLRLGLLLAFLLFQLEHYENYLWAGSSIDHFLVVMLATGAFVALASDSRGGLLAGGLLAALGTYTLAHGLAIWPVGALMLWRAARPRALGVWCAMSAISVGSFLLGFKVNAAQDFATLSPEGVIKVIGYWLSLLGALPAIGDRTIAPFLGVLLLGLLMFAIQRGAARREPITLPLALFSIAAAGMISVGRAEDSGGEIYSRYYILSGLAWAMALFMALNRHSHPRRPLQPLLLSLPILIGFNVTATIQFADETDSWIEARDRAITRFKQFGIDGLGPFTLHPSPPQATDLLQKTESLGLYRLGLVCRSRPFPKNAAQSNRLAYFIDEMTVNPRSAFVRGWVAIPGHVSRRGQIHVILRSERETLLFDTVSITRPDVAAANNQPGWERAGFRFVRRRDRLPSGEFQLGLLITENGRSEYIMTAHRLRLVGEGEALLATGD